MNGMDGKCWRALDSRRMYVEQVIMIVIDSLMEGSSEFKKGDAASTGDCATSGLIS